MNYELQFQQSFAKQRRKLDSNYVREGRIKKCETCRRGRGFIGEEGAAPKGVRRPQGGVPPPHHGGNPLFIPFMVVTPSST
jgi:hypothetical protein